MERRADGEKSSMVLFCDDLLVGQRFRTIWRVLLDFSKKHFKIAL